MKNTMLLQLYIALSCKKRGYKNIKIDNIRVQKETEDKDVFLADVSYVWYLNAHEHRAEHKDALFILKNGQFLSTIFID